MTSLRQTVMLNNGLTESDADVYQDLLYQIAADYNGDSYNGTSYSISSSDNSDSDAANDNFILGMHWNMTTSVSSFIPNFSSIQPDASATKYKQVGSSWQAVNNVNLVHKRMNDLGDFGDIQTVYVEVAVAQPFWDFNSTSSHGSQNWVRNSQRSIKKFQYLYFVPCLQYTSVDD